MSEGAPAECDEEVAKKKRSLFTKIRIGVIIICQRSSRRKYAILALLLLISSSMLANFRHAKDASRYLDVYTNKITLSHLYHKPARTAAICAVQKWGLPYIDEWVDYHLAIGFETIFIYDNSDDFETLGWYSNRFHNGTDRVKIFHWPGVAQQLPAYDECIRHIKHSSDQDHFWIAFIDIDEFIVIKDTEKFPFITDFLETVPQDAGGVTVNWQVFGWNNQIKYEAKPLSLRFNLFQKALHVKTIARTDRLIKIGPNPHVAQYTNHSGKNYTSVDTNGEIVEGPFNNRMPTDVLAINHYQTRSLEEYRARCKRGRATISISLLKGKNTYPPCLPEEVLLANWQSHRNEHFEFDDNVWKVLKRRVPVYTKYETSTNDGTTGKTSMLANFRHAKDASRYSNNVKKLSHLPHKPARTAAICAVQKWGLPYIDEWVDYHLAIGFETIFIYDNSDDFEMQGWYSNRFHNGTDRVEIFHWPGVAQQLPAYDECIRHINQDHFWIAFIDIDEFIVIKDTEKFPFITDFLETVPQDAGGVTATWQVFGWNNQIKYEAKPLSLRFNLFQKALHVKTIARTDRLMKIGPNPHVAQYEKNYTSVDTNGETVEGPFNNRMPTDVLAINHYQTRSLEEYKARCKRGRATISISLLKGNDTYPPCLPEEVLLARWRSHSHEHFEFDDNVWKVLKKRVPVYTKYETSTKYTDLYYDAETDSIESCLRPRSNSARVAKLRPPFINLGMPKMGSSSLHSYFQCGGHQSVHWLCGNNKTYCGDCIKRAIKSDLLPLPYSTCNMSKVDSYAQIDKGPENLVQVNYLNEIVGGIPNATFILTFRDMTKWYSSLTNWVGTGNKKNRMRQRFEKANITGLPVGVGRNVGEFSSFYCEYVKRVRREVAKYPGRHELIEIDIEDPTAGFQMEEAFGINHTCWGQANTATHNFSVSAEELHR